MGIPAVAKRTLPPPVTVLTPDLNRLSPVASISRVPPLTRASPVLKAVPVSWMALEGRLVIMLTPSLATVLSPEVPALKTVLGADTMFWGAVLTSPVPGHNTHSQTVGRGHNLTGAHGGVGKVGDDGRSPGEHVGSGSQGVAGNSEGGEGDLADGVEGGVTQIDHLARGLADHSHGVGGVGEGVKGGGDGVDGVDGDV